MNKDFIDLVDKLVNSHSSSNQINDFCKFIRNHSYLRGRSATEKELAAELKRRNDEYVRLHMSSNRDTEEEEIKDDD